MKTTAIGLAILSCCLGAYKTVEASQIIAVPAPAYGDGFVSDSASSTGSLVYGPALTSVTGTGTTSLGAYTNSASSSLVNGDPAVQVSGSSGSWAQATLVYQYEITGTGGVSVPVILTGAVSATDTGVTGAYADAQINPGSAFANSGPVLFICSGALAGCGQGVQQNAGSLSFNVTSGVIESIYMIAEVNSLSATVAGSISAYADPTIAIDPSFAQYNQFSVILSPGVSAAVPLPSPAIFMLSGLLGLGACARKNHKASMSV
ncbi:MAG: hypothetical protein ABSB19_14740 [Methylomonas sp.]|jgi:hypothetical protein